MSRATRQATSRFRTEHPAMKFVTMGKTDLLVSQLGLGTFRLNNSQNPTKLVGDALDLGYNVFDTAPHFGKGQCELLLGQGLKTKQGIKREEFVIVNKVGFVPPNTPKFPDMYEINRVKYCLHPSYIEHQLTQSLKTLNVDAIDVYLLNNPERIVHAQDKGYTMDRCYDEIQRAFEHLKLEVERGRIGHFGLASNTMALTQTPDHLKLERLLPMGGVEVVEYPLNIFEPDAFQGGEQSLMSKCQLNGLYQISQRPLLAITPVGVLQLTNSNLELEIEQLNVSTQKLFFTITDLEYMIGAKSIILFKIVDETARFSLANLLAENLAHITVNEMAGSMFIEKEIKPMLQRDLLYLKTIMSKVDQDEKIILQQLAQQYSDQVQLLLKNINLISKYHSDRTNEGINSALKNIGHNTIEMNALGMAVSSINTKGTVLIGASNPKDLVWPLELFKFPAFKNQEITRIIDLARISL